MEFFEVTLCFRDIFLIAFYIFRMIHFDIPVRLLNEHPYEERYLRLLAHVNGTHPFSVSSNTLLISFLRC